MDDNTIDIVIFSAVREDRMPGGRNSGAVYNMYPCKVGAQVNSVPWET